MIGVVRYFKHTPSGRISIYRALQKDDITIVTQGKDLSGDGDYSELTQEQYDTEIAAERAARSAANQAAVQRDGILDRLVNKADDLLGGIL